MPCWAPLLSVPRLGRELCLSTLDEMTPVDAELLPSTVVFGTRLPSVGPRPHQERASIQVVRLIA